MMNAKETFSKIQKTVIIIFLLILICALVLNYKIAITTLLLGLTSLYFINILISFYISYKSIFYSEEIEITSEDLKKNEKRIWPSYTILCPLYKEENIIESFASNIASFDYPKDKIECLLLLEESDSVTIKKARTLNLPDYFKILIVPESYPKTKPKACNIGLDYAKGDLLVIYDAEDRPESDQLKKAALVFDRLDSQVCCVQAKLNFYNQKQNFLTGFFTSEYSLWFDLILPGFQSINAPIPLGGTSNHFRTSILKSMKGWDPYNVTEDCDLGIRLKTNKYRTVILNSTTWEEANSQIGNWIRQRSRWIKGYFQTFLVYTRKPIPVIHSIGLFNFFMFCMITGFLPFTSMINPFLWITTICYFAFRPEIGGIIESFYPAAILYPAVFCLIFGNFIYVYNYIVASHIRQNDTNAKFGLAMPFYWIFISVAAWYGFIQLLLKPHYWEKTNHGLNQLKEANV